MTMSPPDGGEEATALRSPQSDSAGKRRESRFTPGTIISDRYRIVALVGSGGMGEVYRAEDMKLGQQVALKFLPRSVAPNASGIQRLYDEVRLGRQVSHPNVCRLYDVADWEGNPFLAMEYVDGEDLASLLRRIGKLPHDKALDIARGVCAGIAAAHGLGIIHRDLKPANIMIDGRGTARITDFGLAAVAEELKERREIAGTPMYMAPEQLTSGNVTQKTDLYALGLILYEIFTGRRLFDPATAGDISSRRLSTKSHSASSETRDIDPAVQRVILRCLEEDPQARPPSIHAVIAALPGGDPLQAALDAGETPSPQMVAAAGTVGDLQPVVAWSLLAASIAGLIVVSVLIGRTMLFRLVPLPKPPEVLIERAQNIVQRAGYIDPPVATAYYFDFNDDFFRYVSQKHQALHDWSSIARLRPGVFDFGYRQSPRELIARTGDGRVVDDDPPETIPGMIYLWVDPLGRLISFTAIPPDIAPQAAVSHVDWSVFLAEAGGDFVNLKPVTPQWTPPVAADERFAWEGNYRGNPTPIRIEAAAYRGKPVDFRVIGPWRRPLTPKEDADALQSVLFSIPPLLVVMSIVIGAVLAVRHLRQGRGDRLGAKRLGIFVFVSGMIATLVRISHVTNISEEWNLVQRGMQKALFGALLIWMLYLALEPYVRRRWPYTLISWRRLLSGRLRDPMVGRDLLLGLIGGLMVMTLRLVTVIAPQWFGKPPLRPLGTWASPLSGTRHLIYAWMTSQVQALSIGMFILFLLFLLFMLFRRRAAAIAGVFLFIGFLINFRGESPVTEILLGLLMSAAVVFLLTRFGLLAFATAIFVDLILTAAPITLDASSWYFGRSFVVLLALLAIAAYGFYISLGDKPLFSAPVLE